MENHRWIQFREKAMAIYPTNEDGDQPKNHWKHEGMTIITLQTRQVEGFTVFAKYRLK